MDARGVLPGAGRNNREGYMYELTAVGFKGTHRASEVLNQVQALNDQWTLFLRDGVAVYRTENGKLHIDQSVEPTGRTGAVWGGLLGGLLGALLAAPFTAGASVAAAGAAVGASALAFGVPGAVIGADDAETWKDTYGVPEDYVKQVSGMVQPGQSAIFVFADAKEPEQIAERFRGYGGTVLRTTLPPEKAKKLQEALAAH
jgi:uncharacterized membrane protein